MVRKRIGIVGFGHLGRYLTNAVVEHPGLELAFVWNRTQQVLEDDVEKSLICRDLEDFASFQADLIVEVAHPVITEKFGARFLKECDFLVGSPTALASREVEEELRRTASNHGLYIPSGALWGGQDIAKMADANTLKSLKITMKKHPSCFKLAPHLQEINDRVKSSPVTLFEGSVRDLSPLAPNNVNTMAAAAIAAHNLGFDGVTGCLVSDPGLSDWHVVQIEIVGPAINGNSFNVVTTRKNPANIGVVTGSATYGSFLASILRAGGQGPGVHLC